MYSFLIFGIYFVAMKELNAYRKKNGCMKSNSNHEKLERKCFKHKQLWSCTTVPLIPNMTLLWLPSFLESCPSFPFSYWVIFTQITAFFFPLKLSSRGFPIIFQVPNVHIYLITCLHQVLIMCFIFLLIRLDLFIFQDLFYSFLYTYRKISSAYWCSAIEIS